MILPIVTHPNPILRRIVKQVDRERLTQGVYRPLIEMMINTMRKAKGVGLAANQVNEDLALCVVETSDGPLVLANPRISHKSFRKVTEEEGCLSLPGIYGYVKRSLTILVDALTPTGESAHFSAKGFLARVIQHEVDHLNGILIIDKFSGETHLERS